MNIIETDIPDIDIENIDESKVNLANKIVKNIFPLFDEVLESKTNEIEELEEQLTNKKVQVLKSKDDLELKIFEYNKSKKVKKLLDRISKLVTSGLVFDGNLRHETVILLKIINKLPDDKVDYHLAETSKTISKRFARL